ncbi:hypothetical protein Hte_001466 [Hypoxylon texense]
MPPKPLNVAFTNRDMEILALAWQCFDGMPRINYDKLAELASFKNGKSARDSFLHIRKKLAAAGNGGAGVEARGEQAANGQPKRKPSNQMIRSPKKAKAGPRSALNIEDDDEDIKPKRRVAAKRQVKKEEDVDSDEKDEILYDEV